jgi:hypothetical protein
MLISDRWLRHLAGNRPSWLRITCESNCSIWGTLEVSRSPPLHSQSAPIAKVIVKIGFVASS